MRIDPACLAIGMLTAAAFGCSSDSTTPNGTGRVVFQIATAGSSTANAPAAADVVISKGGNTVTITQVELVARKIRLLQSDAACEDDDDEEDDAAAPATSSDRAHEEDADDDDEEDEDCPVLKLGPLLLNPPLADGAITSFTADVPAGTYTRLLLQIHKPRGDNDQAFLAAHPEFADVSIRVTGSYNGAPFTFDTDISVEEALLFPAPVVVTAGGTTAFTLFLDVRDWFVTQGGVALLDPLNPTDAVRELIEHNIQNSFRAFRDEDHDGDQDEDHDGH